MNRVEFTHGVANVRSSGDPTEQIEALVRSLLGTRTRWSLDAMVDMVHGIHGEKVATSACRCLTRGLAPTITSFRGESVTFANEPFFQWCVQFKRHDVLRSLVLRGAPEPLAFMFTAGDESTTQAGRLLDAMCSVAGDERASCAKLLSDLAPFTYLPRDGLVGAVTLLAEVDPYHQGVLKHLAMTELGAEFTAARMRLHIDQAVAAAPASIANSAPARARHAL